MEGQQETVGEDGRRGWHRLQCKRSGKVWRAPNEESADGKKGLL